MPPSRYLGLGGFFVEGSRATLNLNLTLSPKPETLKPNLSLEPQTRNPNAWPPGLSDLRSSELLSCRALTWVSPTQNRGPTFRDQRFSSKEAVEGFRIWLWGKTTRVAEGCLACILNVETPSFLFRLRTWEPVLRRAWQVVSPLTNRGGQQQVDRYKQEPRQKLRRFSL